MSEEERSDEAREYELALVLQSPESEKKVGDYFAGHGITPTVSVPFRPLQLAYPIKKQRSGYFGCFRFRGTPENIKAFREGFRLESEVIRFLIVAVPERREGRISRTGKPAELRPQTVPRTALTNEALEETLEEILK